jgi:acyl-CoA thioester hydrolase
LKIGTMSATETPVFRVRYAETDAQAVAYYGSYFAWQEVGTIHFLETHGISLPELDRQGVCMMTAETYARFRRPAVYDDPIVVRTRLAQAAPKRVMFENEIVRAEDGELLALGRTAYVAVHPSGAVLPVPDLLLSLAEERAERVAIAEKADEILASPPPGARSCTAELKVRYAETDAQGVAYYGCYYAWFEVGRTEMTRSVGLPYRDLERQGVLLPVAEAYCRHFGPLRPCERFNVLTLVPPLGKARMTFVHRLSSLDGQKEFATGYTVHACTGRDGRPHGLPPEVIARFAPAP